MIVDRAMRAGVMAIRSTGYAWVILACGVVVSVASFYVINMRAEAMARLRFENEVRDAGSRIENRVRSYADVLYGVRALFQAKGLVSRREFHDYVSSLNLSQRYPGFQILNFETYVTAGRKAAFEAAVRRDASLNGVGYPDFHVKLPGDRPAYYVLTYLEPMQGNEGVFGNDIAMNNFPINLRLFEKMRDGNELSSSGRLVQVRGADQHVGLSMRLPVYRVGSPIESVEQRRSAYLGSVGAGFRVRESLEPIISQAIPKPVEFRLYNIGPAGTPATPDRLVENTLLYSKLISADDRGGGSVAESKDSFTAIQTFEFGGRQMVIHFLAEPGFYVETLGRRAPFFALVSLLTITLLLSALVYSLARSRRQAQMLAAEMTIDLNESEAFLAEAQRMAHIGSWLLHGNGQMRWSDETRRILGVADPRSEASIEEFLQFIHPDDRELVRSLLWDCFESHERQEMDHRLLLKDGTLLWIHSIVESTVLRGEKLVRGTSKDITLAHSHELRQKTENEIVHALAVTVDRANALQKFVEALTRGMGWPCGVAWIVDAPTAALKCAASWGRDRTYWSFFEACRREGFEANSPLLNSFAHSAEPLWVDDIEAAAEFPLREQSLQAGFRRALLVPVIVDAGLHCVLEFCMDEFDPHQDETRNFARRQADHYSHYLQRRDAESRLQFVVAHDALTQLPNRASFHSRLVPALKRAERNRHGLAVLFVDLDRFKVVNDTIGHSAGDKLLKECAGRFKACLRETDTLSRLGGDEFVVLVDQVNDPHQVTAVAQRLLGSLASPFTINSTELTLSASIGISNFPEDGGDAETLVKNADIALYRAKQEGRGSYQFYSAALNQYSLDRLDLEAGLRRALERDEFRVHYQPKLSILSGRMEGMEALIRWRRPNRGLVGPDQFIPIAEETGLIIAMGNWVLKSVCMQLAQWKKQGRPPCRVSVNLSARQFRDQNLLKDISGIVKAAGVEPALLEFELTESMVMNDPDKAISIMRALRATGFTLSIDDFGTGYSSLGRLKSFPIHSLKIDRTFVKGLPDDQDDVAIARGVIALAHSLRLSVVAEGVETPEQFEFLKSVGCDEIQGYLVSRPLPAGQAMAVVEHGPGLRLISSGEP